MRVWVCVCETLLHHHQKLFQMAMKIRERKKERKREKASEKLRRVCHSLRGLWDERESLLLLHLSHFNGIIIQFIFMPPPSQDAPAFLIIFWYSRSSFLNFAEWDGVCVCVCVCLYWICNTCKFLFCPLLSLKSYI